MPNVSVSVITPIYNNALYISQAIESVLSQTYQNWEMIIIDDCSTDDSVKYIRRMVGGESRVKLITLNKNIGAAAARNKGLKTAKGRYIAFLDSDDVWSENKLDSQIRFMKNGSHPISFTSYELIDDSANSINKSIPAVESLSMDGYIKNTAIGFSTSIIDTKLIKGGLRFRDLRVAEDFSFWVDVLGCGNVAYGLDSVLSRYRVHSNSLSANKFKSAKQILYSLVYIHKFGYVKSIYYFCFYIFNAIRKRI